MAPGGLRASSNTLCAFADELPAALTSQVYGRCHVIFPDQAIALPAYARFDTAKASAEAADAAVVVDDVAVAVERGALLLRSGRRIACGVVVDSTGAAAALSRATRDPRPRAFQTAFGLVVRGVDEALPPGSAVFMDWSKASDDDDDDDGPPSFLYALCGDDGTLLLEETALGARPAVDPLLLRRRLLKRLARRGTRIDAILGEEVVSIPLDLAVPRPTRDVVAFGVAAGLVHPCTGFHLARAVRVVDDVAAALDAGLADGAPPGRAAAAAFSAVWTRDALTLRDLQLCRCGASANKPFCDGSHNKIAFKA